MASRPEKILVIQGIGLAKCFCLLIVFATVAAAQVPPDFKSLLADTTKAVSTAPSAIAAAPKAVSQNPGTAVRKDSSSNTAHKKPDTLISKAGMSPIDSAAIADSIAAVEAKAAKARRLKFEFFEIEDPELLVDLWQLTGRDSTPEEGHYQVLKVRGDSVSHAYLLREGTQVGRLPDSVVAGLRRVIRTRSGMQEGRLSQNLIGNFWNPVHPLAPFQWPTGLYLSHHLAGTVLENSSPEIEQAYGGSFAVRPFPWAHVEIGGFRSRYAGGINRNLYHPRDNSPSRDWISNWHYWGYFAIGVPGIKYEIGLDNRSVPEYFWLDPNGGSGSYVIGREKSGNPVTPPESFNDGTVIKGWRKGGRLQQPTPNYSQTLRLKIGQVRYSAVFDPDVYNSVIHDLMFDELPAPFGQWGLGFVLAEGAAHTHLRFDLFPIKLGVPVPKGSTFEFFLMRFEIAVRDGQTFHIGVATVMHLDSPILRPGGKP